MAKDIKIRNNVYESTPRIDVPINNSNEKAHFYDVSDANLDSGSKMLDGVTGYGPDGVLYEGSIPEKDGDDLSVSGPTVTVPAGHYAQQAQKSVPGGAVTAPASVAGTDATVTPGTNTLKLSKAVSITPNVTAAGYIANGTPGNANVELTAAVPTKAAATLQPGTSAVTIPAGTYCAGAQTIPAEPNFVESNIVAGVSLWGKNGTAQIPVISQDATTKVLTIS